MEFNKDNFILARFANPERNTVEVFYTDEDEVVSIFLEVDAEDPQFSKLLEIVTIDEIELKTLEYFNEEKEALINFHKALIEKNLVEIEQASAKKELTSIEVIRFFLFFDQEITDDITNEERLFSLKIACFDIEEVENGSDELKEQIRNAQTPLELLNIIYDDLHNEESDS